MSVVTFLPMIQIFSKLEDPLFQSLCFETLNMIINVLKTQPAFSLSREPSECMNSYRDFIYSLVINESLEKSRRLASIHALILLAVNRGRPADLLHTVNMLFKSEIHIGNELEIDQYAVDVDGLMNQLSSYCPSSSLPILKETYDLPFRMEAFARYKQANAKSNFYSSIACDGSYLYILNEVSLSKIGTGFGGTIKGLTYQSNSQLKVQRSVGSIAWVDGKLYILEHSDLSGDEKQKRELVVIRVDCVNLKILEPMKILDTYCMDESSLISDGNLLYLCGYKKNVEDIGEEYMKMVDSDDIIIEQSDEDWDSEDDVRYINVVGSLADVNNDYNPNRFSDEPADIPEPKRYKIPKTRKLLVQIYKANSDHIADVIEPFDNFHFSYTSCSNNPLNIFSTGLHFVILESKNEERDMTAYFHSMIDGSNSDLLVPVLCNNSCYDTVNNIIWTYSSHNSSITPYINPGCTPRWISTSMYPCFKEYSPEFILKELKSTQPDLYTDYVILSIMATMDRIGRSHPFYSITEIVDQQSLSFLPDGEPHISIEPNVEVLSYLVKVLKASLALITDASRYQYASYTALVSLRLLKVNLYEIFSDNSKVPASLRKSLKELLLGLYQANLHGEILEEAMNVIVIGFNFFFEETAQKLEFLEGLLTFEGTTPHKDLTQKLLLALTKWLNVGDLFLDYFKDRTSHAITFFETLVYYSRQESVRNLKIRKHDKVYELTVSPSVKLLLCLQREILYSTKYKCILQDYLQIVIRNAISLIEDTRNMCLQEMNTSDRAIVENILESSFLKIVLQPLLIGLCYKPYSRDISFASSIIDSIVELLSSIDTFNHQFDSTTLSDRRYILSISNKKEKKFFISAKDFEYVSTGMYQTSLTISDAEHLSLKFDKTPPSFNTTLHIFGKNEQHYTFTSINWPKHSLDIVGNFSKFVLYTKDLDDKMFLKVPLKCLVTGVSSLKKETFNTSWLLHLENTVALLGGICSSLLIEGEVPSDIERNFCSNLVASPLFNGKFVSDSFTTESFLIYQPLTEWIRSLNPNMIRYTPTNKCHVETIEKLLYIAFIIHSGLNDIAISISNEIQQHKDIDPEEIRIFKFIGQKVANHLSYLIRRCEILKYWNIAVLDRIIDINVLDNFRQDTLRLKEICDIKGVRFDSDIPDTMDRLFMKFSEEVTSGIDPKSPFEVILGPAIEKVELLTCFTHVKDSSEKYSTWDGQFNDASFKDSPMQSVITFLSLPYSRSEVEDILRIQVNRAKTRVQGFLKTEKLLKACSYSSTQHQVLGPLAKIFCNDYHYLRYIQLSGLELTTSAISSFSTLVYSVVQLLQSPEQDTISRLLSLSICAVECHTFDYSLLRESNIFKVLASLISEYPQCLVGIEHKNIITQLLCLKQSVWVAFKVLAIRCLSWNVNKVILDNNDIQSFQQDIIELAYFQLHKICNVEDVILKNEPGNDSNDHISEILSLIYLLGSYFHVDNVNRVNILMSALDKAKYPKSLRLICRLLRKVIQDCPDFITGEILERLLIEIGKFANFSTMSQKTIAIKDKPLDILLESQELIHEGEEYGVYLLTLPSQEDFERLFSLSVLGEGQSKELFINKVSQDVRVQGYSLVKKGSMRQCERYSTSASELGCISKIEKLTSHNEIEKQKGDFRYWINGNVAASFCSEYITIFHLILSTGGELTMRTQDILAKYIKKLPDYINSSSSICTEDICKLMASLHILSTQQEPIRVGGKVIISHGDSEEYRATILSVSDMSDFVKVIYDGDTLTKKNIHKVDSNHVSTIQEFPPKFSNLAELGMSLLPYLLSVLSERDTHMVDADKYFYCLIQSRALQVVLNFLESEKCVEYLLSKRTKKDINRLLARAKTCKDIDNMSKLERIVLIFGLKLWNVATRPTLTNRESIIQKALPHFNNASDWDMLPNGLELAKRGSLVYWGKLLNRVENIDVRRSRNRKIASEVMITGNYYVADIGKDYYFEMRIEKAPSDPRISIGLCKDGTESWGRGVLYRYQANKKKEHVSSPGNIKTDPYGETFKEGNTIGCGWNQLEKMIYFTKDGRNLGIAFKSAFPNNESVVPVIGIGKNVKVTVNFGQYPFIYAINNQPLTLESRSNANSNDALAMVMMDPVISEYAETIVNMGYEMRHALRALEATGYSGIEDAANWLLEAGDQLENEPMSIEESMKDSDQFDGDLDLLGTNDDKPYKITSHKYVLNSNLSYPTYDRNKRQPKNCAKHWEQRMTLLLRQSLFSEERMKNSLVNRHINDIMAVYKSKGEPAALQIIRRLLKSDSSFFLSLELRMSQIKIGMMLMVNPEYNYKDNSCKPLDWCPSMDTTIGHIGVVRQINFISNRVLLEFYDKETSLLESWWYPPYVLKKTQKRSTFTDKNEDQLLNSLADAHHKLSAISSRRILIHLMKHQDFHISTDTVSDMSWLDALSLCSSEYMSSPLAITSTSSLFYEANESSYSYIGMEIIASRMIEKLQTLQSSSLDIQTWFNDMISTVDTLFRSNPSLPQEHAYTSWDSPSNTMDFKFEDARVVCLYFSKSSCIPERFSIDVILNDYKEELFYTYKHGDKLSPLLVPHNNFTLVFKSRSNHKKILNFTMVPLNSTLSLCKWLSEFLLEYSIEYKFELCPLFNNSINYVFKNSIPSCNKEAFINFLTRFIHLEKLYFAPYDSRLALKNPKRLEAFNKEMQTLYDSEKDGLCSTYLQSLIELVASIKMQQLEERIRRRKYKGSKLAINKDNESNMNLALSLAKSLKEEINEYLNMENASVFDVTENDIPNNDEDDDLIKAISLSLSNLKSPESTLDRKEKNQKAKVNLGPTWLKSYIECYQLLEILSSRSSLNHIQNDIISDLIRKIWETTKRDYNKEGFIMFDNVPEYPAERMSWVKQSVEDFFDDLSVQIKSDSIWIPCDHTLGVTKSYIIVQLLDPSNVSKIENSSIKCKLDSRSLLSNSRVIRIFPSLLRGNSNLKRNRTLQKNTKYDHRVVEYMKSQLILDGALTHKFHRVLMDLFITYSVDQSSDSILDQAQLDLLQFNSTGQRMDRALLDYLFENFESKSHTYKKNYRCYPGMSREFFEGMIVSSNQQDEIIESTGITLNGFLNFYLQQASANPMETWEELFSLGYDINLQHSYFMDVNDAVDSILHNPLFNTIRVDEEIVRYAENLVSSIDIKSPLKLNHSYIEPLKDHLVMKFPTISKLTLPTLRLRFEMLRYFNEKLNSVLHLINLEGDSIISQRLSYCRMLVFHNVKMKYIYEILEKTSVQGNQPTVAINRLKIADRIEKSKMESQFTDEMFLENTSFGIAYSQLKGTDPKNFRQKKPGGTDPHFSLHINYKGENVEGDGGPYRQFFTDVSSELIKTTSLLILTPNSNEKIGKNRGKYIIKPSCKSKEKMGMYRFLGNLMGMAIRTGVLVSIDFPAFFWKPLVGEKLTLDDLKDIDFSFYKFIGFIKTCKKEDLEGPNRKVYEKFTVRLSDESCEELKENGSEIDLTYENRNEYIKLATKKRLNEHMNQILEIKRGLTDCVPSPLLHLCSWKDLEWKVSGKPYIDIELLKRHTEYSETNPQAPHIKYFWNVLRSFTQPQKRAFIRFVWAQERLPSDDSEFIRTSTRMLIKPYRSPDPDSCYPKVDTCFFNISLPMYSSMEVCMEKLLSVISMDVDSLDGDTI